MPETAFVVRWRARGKDVATIRTPETMKAFTAILEANGIVYTVKEFDVSELGQIKCRWHVDDIPSLTYSAYEKDAKARMAKGQEQRFCDECGFYFWPDTWGQKPND